MKTLLKSLVRGAALGTFAGYFALGAIFLTHEIVALLAADFGEGVAVAVGIVFLSAIMGTCTAGVLWYAERLAR